jgi:transcriptional regulator with XRE-family HTH domain
MRYSGVPNSGRVLSIIHMAKPTKFSNYLRANRKRLGLSQEDVAYLLGADSGAKVCRYEQFVREPSLKTALACEAVFQKTTRELLPELYHKIARDVVKRAKALLRKTERLPPGRQRDRKCKALHHIINGKLEVTDPGV